MLITLPKFKPCPMSAVALLLPVLWGPALALATETANDSALTAAANTNWSQVSIGAKPFSVAEQELLSERQKEQGKTAAAVDYPKPADLQYPIEVKVDDAQAKAMLEEHLPLIVQQQMNADIDLEQIQFLVEDTPQDAKDMLDTLGYFNAQVTVSQNAQAYVVQVNLGERVFIQEVTLNLAGPILDDEKLGEYYANANEGWIAKVGDPFLQDAWSSSKSAAVSGIRRKKYPLAQMTQSQALIDPAAKTAVMSATVDSRQPIYFGALEVNINEISLPDGSKTNQKPRYPKTIVEKLAAFKEGEVYDSDRIVDFQNALEQDSHYSNVMVAPQFNRLQEDHVPIVVDVQEVPRQKFDVGLNFDSEDGHGFRVAYEHYNVLNRGYVGTSFLSYNKYEQSFGLGLSHPREVGSSYNMASLNYKNGTVQKVKTASWNAGVWNVKEGTDSERRLGLEFYRDDSYVENGPDYGVNYATLLTASWRYNRVETKSRPQNGYYVYGKVGASAGTLLSSASMQLVRADAAYYYTPEQKQYGTFIVRGKAGVVNVSDQADAPQSLLFRTGGASSVRGYEHESIGIMGYEDAVMGGKIMSVASLEYLLPIKKDYALAVFHDMGDVSNRFDEFKIQHGTGIGARWFSPFAPIAFDLAYGHEDQKIRWYIGLGTQF